LRARISQADITTKTIQEGKMKRSITLVPAAFRGVVAGALVLFAGCASHGDFPPAPARADISGAPDYLIGPGDGLNIQVWRNPEVSTSVTVRPDGKINTPLVDDMVAANKTPTQLERDLEKHLAKFIQDPIVTVIVTGFNGPYSQQVRVIGQAAKPQALQYREKMTLMDVMIAVGGITDFAAGNKATIVRTWGGKQQQFSVRLEDLMRGGDISANVEMMPGDVLIIPESFF
jgi:polysaccharide export outer membrane protein